MFVALAAAVLPVVRPDLYKESAISAWEIAGIPLCIIFGILGFFGISFFIYAIFGLITTGLIPAAGGTIKTGGTLTADLIFFVAFMTLGLIIALSNQYMAMKKGIPVSEIFKKIPPA